MFSWMLLALGGAAIICFCFNYRVRKNRHSQHPKSEVLQQIENKEKEISEYRKVRAETSRELENLEKVASDYKRIYEATFQRLLSREKEASEQKKLIMDLQAQIECLEEQLRESNEREM